MSQAKAILDLGDDAVATVRNPRAEAVVRTHVLWALGAGLVPLPLFDLVAVLAVQLDMLRNLARTYQADFAKDQGKAFVSALTGTTFARLGASAVKAIPGVGSVLGGVSMSVMAGASTYAVGRVAIQVLEEGDGFLDIDLDRARKAYDEALERGKKLVSELRKDKDKARDVFEKIRQLDQLKQEGSLSEEEVEEKKRELLSRL